MVDPNVRQVSETSREVESVTYDEGVRDAEADIVDGHLDVRVGWFFQQRADLEGARLARGEVVDQVAHGEPGVDDVFDHEHVETLDGMTQITRDFHHSAGFGGVAIAGDTPLDNFSFRTINFVFINLETPIPFREISVRHQLPHGRRFAALHQSNYLAH